MAGTYREEHEPSKGRDHGKKLEGVLGHRLLSCRRGLPCWNHGSEERFVIAVRVPCCKLIFWSSGRHMLDECIRLSVSWRKWHVASFCSHGVRSQVFKMSRKKDSVTPPRSLYTIFLGRLVGTLSHHGHARQEPGDGRDSRHDSGPGHRSEK